MNDPFTQMKNRVITGNIQIQPMNDLRIDFNFLQNYTSNLIQGGYNILNNGNLAYANELITYSYSDALLKTSFKDGDEIFRNMIANAQMVSQKMGGLLQPNGFTEGHGITNAYVLLPAFQSAVEGREVNMSNSPTQPKFPLPNWKITYSGLRNMPFINSQFSKFDLLHSYKATYTASGIQSSIDYFNDPNGVDVNKDKLNPYVFSQVGYVEEFAPLIGADVTMRNNMQIRAMYNRNRMYMLGLKNHTLTEDSGSEYIIGFGYILKDLKLNFRFRGKENKIKTINSWKI